MVAAELARAYAFLDRTTFCYLKMNNSCLLENLLEISEQRVRHGNGLGNLATLCDGGCEREELLWLLSGCCGPAIILSTERLFGFRIEFLNRNLELLRNCANITASLSRSVFGVLLGATLQGLTLGSIPQNLRTLARLGEAAKRDFKNAEWFLSVAKVRLTDHVTYKSHSGEPHDKQLSGLIAAATRKDYAEDAHRRFRNKYHGLLSNRRLDPSGDWSLDPYTVHTDSQRQETIETLAQGMRDHPEIRQAVESHIRAFAQLTKKLPPVPRTAKRRKSRVSGSVLWQYSLSPSDWPLFSRRMEDHRNGTSSTVHA